MAQQYIFTMKGLKKVVPPGREILKGIWLSFYFSPKIRDAETAFFKSPNVAGLLQDRGINKYLF